MASVFEPILYTLVQRALIRMMPVAVGAAVGVGSDVVVDSATDALRKQDEAEKAKTSPLAKANPQTKTKDCTKDKKCEECPPDEGVLWPRNFAERQPWVDYQVRICGMPSGPNFVLEWDWRTIKFDGFHSDQCLLQEAKGYYDQFFTRHGQVHEWWNGGELKLIAQAMDQGFIAKPRPPIVLKWYFQEPISFRYFSGIIQAGYPDIEVLFRP